MLSDDAVNFIDLSRAIRLCSWATRRRSWLEIWFETTCFSCFFVDTTVTGITSGVVWRRRIVLRWCRWWRRGTSSHSLDQTLGMCLMCCKGKLSKLISKTLSHYTIALVPQWSSGHDFRCTCFGVTMIRLDGSVVSSSSLYLFEREARVKFRNIRVVLLRVRDMRKWQGWGCSRTSRSNSWVLQ